MLMGGFAQLCQMFMEAEIYFYHLCNIIVGTNKDDIEFSDITAEIY